MVPVSVAAISLLVLAAGVVDHGGPDQVSAPSPTVSTTYFVHTPCVHVNPGGQWHCPPGAQPPLFP